MGAIGFDGFILFGSACRCPGHR